MDIVLTPAEVRQFKEALLSAFSRSGLEQVVYFGLEVRLDNIVTQSNYDKEVTDLVMWVNDNNKVAALLQEARKENPGNVKLREFATYIQARLPGQAAPLPPSDPFKGRKAELVGLLSNLPISATFNRRTRLLDGIPGADGIERDENNKNEDLNMILSDLARRGRLANGELPIVNLYLNLWDVCRSSPPWRNWTKRL